jgi:predicted nucleic acid-binding protein
VILADTSVWIDHFGAPHHEMSRLLAKDQIAVHPFVIGELALGNLKGRAAALEYLDRLPHVLVAQESEVRQMIETHHFYARGIGLIDAHLIASALIDPPARLWTRDIRLRKVAVELGVHMH